LEADVEDQQHNVWAGVVAMAIACGTIAGLLYTRRGRESLQRAAEALDEFSRSLQQLRGTIQKAGLVVAQGIDVAREGVDVVSHIGGREQRRMGSPALH
jgi:hypothetical protein